MEIIRRKDLLLVCITTCTYIVFGVITTLTLFCQLERLNPEFQLAALAMYLSKHVLQRPPGARSGGWEDDQ